MKRVFVLAVLVGIFSIGCPSPITSAKIGVTLTRAALGVVVVSTGTMRNVAAESCKAKKLTGEDFKTCMAPTEKAIVEILKAVPKAKALLDLTDGIIVAVESGKAGEEVNYLVPLKLAVCLTVGILEYLPEDMKKKVSFYLNLLEQYTCKSPNVSGKKMTKADLLIALHNTRAMLKIVVGAQG